MAEETREKTNFIWEAIKADIAEGKNGGRGHLGSLIVRHHAASFPM